MIVGTSVSLMNLALWGQTEPVLFVLKFLSNWSYRDGMTTFGELLNTGASCCCLIKSNLTDSALYTMWCTKPVGITQLFASLLLVTLVKQYEVLLQYEPHCVYCCSFIGEVIGFGFDYFTVISWQVLIYCPTVNFIFSPESDTADNASGRLAQVY